MAVLMTILIIMMMFAPFGVLYLLDLMKKSMGYSRVIVLEKDGTYTAKWMKLKSNKKFRIGNKERLVNPKGRFIGKLGNLFIYVGDNVNPIEVDSTEIKSEIDVDDVSNMVTLAYQAGKQAALKETNLMKNMNLLLLIAAGAAVFSVLLLWQMQGNIKEILQNLHTIHQAAQTATKAVKP